MFKSKVSCGGLARVEVLVKPHVGWHNHGAHFPIVLARLFAFRPHQAVAFTAQNNHVRARAVAMGLFVGTYRKLRDVAVHGATRHVEANVSAARTALFGTDEWQVDGIGHKIGFQQQTFLLALATEVIWLAIEAIGKVVLCVEHKVQIFVQVNDGWAIGHSHKTRSIFA